MTRPKYTIGIDVGGTKMLAVAVDASGLSDADDIALASLQVPTPDDPGEMVQAAVGLVERLTERTSGHLAAIGLGLPGFIGLDGIARQAPNLPGIINRDIVGELRERVGVPVRADNDANCAAWAAACLDAPDASMVVAITLGTGIGGGLVIDGHLVRGAHGFAGEPGHMIVDPTGPECVCGQQGCWEVWASGSGLARLAAAAVNEGRAPGLASLRGVLDGPKVMSLADSGDAEAGAVLREFGRWVAVGLVNLVNLVDPDVVVLSGGIVVAGDALLGVIETELAQFATMQRGRRLDLRISSVGPEAGAIGAALLAAAAALDE